MVPVFVVGVMGASLANCVLAVAAYLKDKLAYEASGGRGVSGDKESIPASACCMPQSLSLVSLSPSCLHGYSHGYLFKSQCPCDNANASQSLFPSFFFLKPVLASVWLTSTTQATWGHCSHLEDSESSRRHAWARSIPCPGPSKSGFLCDRGAPSRGGGDREE